MRIQVYVLAAVLVGCGGSGSSTGDGSVRGGGGDGGMQGSGDAGGTSGGDAAVTPIACSAGCGANALCIDDMCRCLPGFPGDGATCTRDAPPTGLDTRTQDDVCAHWTAGHVTTATTQYTPGTAMCDPGVIEPAAIYDAALRWSMYRWLVGLSPVSVDLTNAADMQSCALMLQYSFSHDQTPATMCYTAGGADAASRSMICSGGDAASCMDAYTLESYATDDHLSHRKIVVGTNRDNVNFGVSSGGSCALYAYATNTPPAPPPFIAVPNQGFAPIDTTTSTWSIHQTTDPLPIAPAQLYDETTSATVPTTQNLQYAGINGFDVPGGVTAGHTYRVTLTDGTNTITYKVTPVTCQ